MSKSQTNSPQTKRDVGARPLDVEGGAGSIDKIRDILFGQQVKEYDKRFAQVEQRLREDTQRLRDELSKRLDSLETYVKGEMDSLLKRLKTEKSERADAVKEVAKELAGTAKNMDKRFSQFDDELSTTERQLREQLLSQAKTLQDDISKRSDEGAKALTRAVGDLRHEKTDRSALSAIFAELAMRISGELDGEAGA